MNIIRRGVFVIMVAIASQLSWAGPTSRPVELFRTDGAVSAAKSGWEYQAGSKDKMGYIPFEGIYPNNTVTAYGIQLALWMGCNPIYIAGLDCKGSHFWGGSDVPAEAWQKQCEAMGYIAGLVEGMSMDSSIREIYNLNHDSACRAFEFGELP